MCQLSNFGCYMARQKETLQAGSRITHQGKSNMDTEEHLMAVKLYLQVHALHNSGFDDPLNFQEILMPSPLCPPYAPAQDIDTAKID